MTDRGPNVVNFSQPDKRREAGEDVTPEGPALAPKGRDPQDPGMFGERLARLEGAFDWLKVAAAIAVAVMIGGFAFLGTQSMRLDAKVDALPEALNTGIREANRAFSDAVNTSLTVFSQRQPQAPQPIIIQIPAQPQPAEQAPKP